MESLFWVSAFVVAYVYAGYPLLIAAWARVAGCPPRRAAATAPRNWPSISIIVAARNEAPRLRPRVENLLALPYPGPREIIVVSDGSIDDPAVSGEILVFADAPRRPGRSRMTPRSCRNPEASAEGSQISTLTECSATSSIRSRRGVSPARRSRTPSMLDASHEFESGWTATYCDPARRNSSTSFESR